MASKNQTSTGGTPNAPRVYKNKIWRCVACDRRSVPFDNGLCPACGAPAEWADEGLLRRMGVLDGE